MAEATKSKDSASAKNAARIAVFDAITDAVADIRAKSPAYDLADQAERIRTLADAYRAVDGGVLPVRTDK